MRGWNAKSLKNRIREGEDERQKSCPDWRKTGRACSGRGPLQIFRDWVQKTEFLPVEARWLVAGYLSTWSVLGLLGRSNHFTQLRAAFRREWWGREMLSGKEADLALNRWALQLFSFGRWRKLHSPHDPFKGHDDEYRVVQLNFTPEMEVWYVLFERYLSMFCMPSLKQQI